MAVEDAIWALSEHWTDVLGWLDARARQELRDLLPALDGPDRGAAVTGIVQLLVTALPPEHAVRRALVTGTLFAPASLDWPSITRALCDQAAVIDLPGGDRRPAGWVLRDVAGRLRGAPALGEEEVRALGTDPADPGLIRLDHDDGSQRWPRFQFGPGGEPVPIVMAINQLLGADDDPIGVADWWLSDNGWLGDAPYRLIGRMPDDLLAQAAHAAIAEV